MTQTTSSEVGARLRAAVRGRVWQRDDDGYDDARRVWNGAVDRRPAVVVRCADADDARTALLVARDSGAALSVRGGGHDWAGRALDDGGVVLDLSALRGVEVDPAAGVAVAQGGALVADVVDPAAAHGVGTATAVVRTVGMAGMTLAGGYGGLAGQFGLALDNLLSADVLLPDGTRVVAGPDGDAELFWALRGGGGNFGIVTAARYRLLPLGPVLGGMVLYPHEQAVQVLRGYRDVLATAPDELTVMAGFVGGPTGEAAVFVAPTWSGDLDAGEAAVAPLLRLGTPVAGGVGPLPYPELIRMFEAGAHSGQHYALGTRWLPTLTDDAIEVLAEAAATWPSPSSLLALHHFHGAATRVAPDATAFALRQEHVLAEVIAAWPGGDAAPHRAWVARVTDALAPGALPGGYPNILGPDDTERARLGFGANADRLLAAKRRYDPDGVLTAIASLGA
ncbi:FAD-binding oxidoreductase [Cellulomonas humilata]|uniref:FAD/FMN-containing dehydrogenase n=1 Tax=Cellulomonas humilata TaxID=144055 RepID=A0ABU0EKQ9_9CELL|nr:FAD-binding oxidoreductase [Cellulomonas humilata]MDQ0375636.1 FAD/FMN-containing dehydrogenase [Cellulomonas humilata]